MEETATDASGTWIRDRSQWPLGRMRGWTRDERTGEPTGLTVELDPQAQAALSAPDDVLVLDGSLVMSIRRDEVVLDRTAAELSALIEHDEPAPEDPDP